jgi:hypothetical protein
MRDEADKKTRAEQPSSARRQAEYAARHRAAGRRQRNYWLTDEEAAQVATLVEKLRGGK